MADSVYISSNLTASQLEFIKLLDEYEIDIFRFEEIEDQLNTRFLNLHEVLENLVHKKLLSRIEKGKFCRFNFRNEYVIGTFLANQGSVGYWSALNLHGLTEQFPNTVFIQTPHKKKDKTIFGVDYKFVKIAHKKRAGITRHGYGNHSYTLTDVEKTIVDCFDLPQYSGGYAELIRAYHNAKLSADKMIQYCRAINNLAATKRMGYLAEFLNKKGMKPFIRFAKDRLTQTYNPLDPLGTDTGKHLAEWKLKLNITEQAILDITRNEY
jgi:predicted transcriptional regulator of viral defense system